MNPLTTLAKCINHNFSDIQLLQQALTHRSADLINNERLEFLGDAILGFIVTGVLFERFPESSEGQLSRLRSHLVKGKTLAGLARKMDLGQYLILGSGELKSGGQRRESILADVVEAIIGAIYLDAGLDTTRQCVISWYGDQLNLITLDEANKDAKTRLQELLQGKRMPLPRYSVVATSGQEHNQIFHVLCELKDVNIRTEGHGSSRRKAEQEAAELALQQIK